MVAKYNFHESYVGPLGPHLNCLSAYTVSRKDEDRLRGNSIHPRNGERGTGRVVNTRKPSTGNRQRRAASAIESHLERHPGDKQSEQHWNWLTASIAKSEAA